MMYLYMYGLSCKEAPSDIRDWEGDTMVVVPLRAANTAMLRTYGRNDYRSAMSRFPARKTKRRGRRGA